MSQQRHDERALLRTVVRSPDAVFLLRLIPAELMSDVGHAFAWLALQYSLESVGRLDLEAARDRLQSLAGNDADALLQMLIDFCAEP